MAFLVQLLLPLYGNSGRRLPDALFADVMDELTDRHGGVTAYVRAPAEGAWKEGRGGAVEKDEVVMFEVMIDHLDRAWWRGYRKTLEQRFDQEELVVRATAMERL